MSARADRRQTPGARLKLIEPSATAEEAAAIMAALERFMRATGRGARRGDGNAEPVARAGLLEGVARDPTPIPAPLDKYLKAARL